jgi:ubiquinone/menaquinone biosynthesis C-methylase UbiE
MDTAPQIKGYYETYWQKGKDTFSGDQQGYAENFRRWMGRQLVDLPPSSPILEVGCGDGSFSKELAKYSADITAIDISESQIAENNRNRHLGGITFRQHDVAERLPYPDQTFQVIWCSEVLEHLFDPAFALVEMYRVLNPGGKLLVTVPYHGRFKNVLIALFKFDEHYTPSNPHIRFYTKATLSRLARKAGFSAVRTDTCGMAKPLRDLFVPTNILLSATKGA